MATPYKSDGVDLDDIFEPRDGRDPARDVAYQVDGVNLSDRYARVEDGSPADPVIYSDGGDNLSDLYAAIGTVDTGIVDPLPWDGNTYTSSDSCEAPCNPLAIIRLAQVGDAEFEITRHIGAPTTELGRVIGALEDPADFEARAVQISGDPVTGTLTEWGDLQRSTTVSLTAERDNEGEGVTELTAVLEVEVREIANPANSVTGTVTLTAEAREDL